MVEMTTKSNFLRKDAESYKNSIFSSAEATIWLVQWMLATHFELASAWYWFFNCFHKAEFNSKEAAESLADFVRIKLTGKHSKRTVKHEVAMILRMYCLPKINLKPQIEDSLDAPLTHQILAHQLPLTNEEVGVRASKNRNLMCDEMRVD